MSDAEFDKLLAKRLDRIKAVLAGKATEYATGRDRLYNFKRAGAMQGCTPEAALVGMWAKHAVSVIDLAHGVRKPTAKLIEEKIGDAVNYLILLEALLTESVAEGKWGK